jgi:hypothetical protein
LEHGIALLERRSSPRRLRDPYRLNTHLSFL